MANMTSAAVNVTSAEVCKECGNIPEIKTKNESIEPASTLLRIIDDSLAEVNKLIEIFKEDALLTKEIEKNLNKCFAYIKAKEEATA